MKRTVLVLLVALCVASVASAELEPLPGQDSHFGRGFDLKYGETRLPIVELSYEEGETWKNPDDGETYAVADPVILTPTPGAKATDRLVIVNTVSDYQKQVQKWHSFGAFFFVGAFSKAKATMRIDKILRLAQDVVFLSTRTFTFYELSSWPVWAMEDEALGRFRSKVERLPSRCSSTEDIARHQKFIRNYGTHFVKHAGIGGRVVYETTVKKELLHKYSEEWVIKQMGLFVGFMDAKLGFAKGSGVSRTDINTEFWESKSLNLIYVGGNVTEEETKVDEWTESLTVEPALVTSRLDDMWGVVSRVSGDDRKAECVRRTALSYLNTKTADVEFGDPDEAIALFGGLTNEELASQVATAFHMPHVEVEADIVEEVVNEDTVDEVEDGPSGEQLAWETALERAGIEAAEDMWASHHDTPGHAESEVLRWVPHNEAESARVFVRQLHVMPEDEARYAAHRMIRQTYAEEGEDAAVDLFVELQAQKKALIHEHRFGAYKLTIKEFFDKVAVKLGKSSAAMAPFVQKMADYWIESVDEMYTITDSEYIAMGIPIKMVRAIRAVFDDITCKMRCEHGSTPNDACTACVGCRGNWNGKNCDSWDPTKKSKAALKQEIMGFKAASDARWAETRRKYKPLPGQVGFGVDLTTGQRRLPVALLTYKTSDRVWTNSAGTTYRVPKEAHFEPLPTGMSFPRSESIAYPTMGSYVHKLYQWSTDLKAKGGTYTKYNDLQSIYKRFFDGENALAVSQQFWSVYKMSLPYDPKTFKRSFDVDPDCLAAMEWLPPSYTGADNQELYQIFVENWGTSYSVETTNGGILEQHSIFRKELVATKGMTPEHIAAQALKDFTNTHSGNSQQVDQAYVRERSLSGLMCTGGDPVKCGSSPAAVKTWSKTIETNPIPLFYSIADISQLVPSETTAINIQKAIHAYIKKQLDAWAKVDTCPPCGKYGSCKPPAEKCTCANSRMSGRTCQTCKSGWSGASSGCPTPICHNCPSSRAVCKSPGNCVCKNKWYGSGCGQCPPGYSTKDCATVTCSPRCVNGRCVGPNTCKCNSPFQGAACDQCPPGWAGTTCKIGQRCFRCGGSGKVCSSPSSCTFRNTCPACRGSGQIASNTIRCPRCSGSGSVCSSPSSCTFRNTCPGCSGKGYVSNSYQGCFRCSGSGSVCSSPSSCTFRNTCPGCSGKGYITNRARRCPKCNGSGYTYSRGFRNSCGTCRGKGYA